MIERQWKKRKGERGGVVWWPAAHPSATLLVVGNEKESGAGGASAPRFTWGGAEPPVHDALRTAIPALPSRAAYRRVAAQLDGSGSQT